MALVKCRECGNEVSDSAVTCPRCGVDGPAGAGRLKVTRRRQMNGSAFSIFVAIDGNTRGKLRSGGELNIDVAPGRHQVEFSYSKGQASGTVNIKSGRVAECRVSISLAGGLKAEIGEG
jgi:hypothetical protein